MNVERLSLPEVMVVKPPVFRDERGHFVETWRALSYGDHRIGPFVQDNLSMSRRGVVRGLHFQHPHGQGKLVSAARGRVFDVAVDVRVGSPNFGQWVGIELSEENRWQLFVPVGFAHGFQALTDDAVFCYKCTDYYDATSEHTIRWDDPAIGVTWPEQAVMIGARDAKAPPLGDIPAARLPVFDAREAVT